VTKGRIHTARASSLCNVIWVVNDWPPSVISPDISRRLAACLSARLHAGERGR